MMFVQSFCDLLEEAKLATHYPSANANYKQFRLEQSFSQPHKVKITYFALPSKEFSVTLDLNHLNDNPRDYTERTMDMISEAREKLKSGSFEVIH